MWIPPFNPDHLSGERLLSQGEKGHGGFGVPLGYMGRRHDVGDVFLHSYDKPGADLGLLPFNVSCYLHDAFFNLGNVLSPERIRKQDSQ